MRITILQDDYPPRHLGGAGAVAHAQARELVRQGHEVLVITAVQQQELAHAYEIDGVRVLAVFSAYPRRLRAWRSLENKHVLPQVRKILTEYKPDVVHAHNVHTHLSYASLKVAKLSGAKVAITFHDAMTYTYGKAADSRKVRWWRDLLKYRRYYNPLRNAIIRRYLACADKKFAVSRALQEALRNNGIRAEVLHNGIATDEWQVPEEKVEHFKDVHGLAGKKVLFFGGRLSSDKGGEAALRMLSAVVQLVPDAVMLVAGKTEGYAEDMRTLSETLRVGKRMVFTGWISGEELKAAFAASDVVCVLSTYLDPFPTVVLEAMASRKPVLATVCGGAQEAVIDGETGYVVDPNDTVATGQRAVELLLDPAKATALGEAGYARITKQFTIAQCVDKLVRGYTD